MIFLSVDSYNRVKHYDSMPFLADLIMSDENKETEIQKPSPKSMGDDWGSGEGSGRKSLFDSPNDFDIYCDRERGTNYIFHGPELNCTIDHLEYDHDTQRITVFTNDSQRFDLGSKIQWLVRPYIAKEQYIYIIRTENGKPIDGHEVKLKIKQPEITETVN